MQMSAIATVRSDFTDRFGIPRQPGLVPASRGEIVMMPPYDDPDALRGLENCSHVWVIFGFHGTEPGNWRPTVRPPRLGGNRRYGVFATRSPYRPNSLGLSLLTLTSLLTPAGRGLAVAGLDLLDGTPVYDLKPYLPAIEAQPDATPPAGFETVPPLLTVVWSQPALTQAEALAPRQQQLVEETIAADPRPAYQTGGHTAVHRTYGMRIAGHEVKWRVHDDTATIEAIQPAGEGD